MFSIVLSLAFLVLTTMKKTEAAAAAFLQGQQAGFITTMENLVSSTGASSGGCLQATQGGSDAVNGASTLKNCGLNGRNDEAKEEDPTNYGLTKLFNHLPAAAITDATGTPAGKCLLTKIATGSGLLSDQDTPSDVAMAGNFIISKKHPGGAEVKTAHNKATGQLTPDIPLLTQTRQKMITFDSHSFLTANTYSRPTLAEVKADKRSKVCAKLYLQNKNDAYDDKADKAGAETAIAAAYGKGTEIDAAKTWTKIENEHVDKKAYMEDATGTEPLSKVKDIEHLLKVLAYYNEKTFNELNEKIKDLEEKSKTNKDFPKSTEELCNAKKDNAKACNETTGCHYDASKTEGRRCTLKPEVKAQLQETNQETGGNDGKTEEKCAKHGSDKNACDNDNNCKWENNACKDSSFILKKKFSLRMAAAFVGMVVF
uniref:Variant surface glycoprotein 1125.3088 n=1 Tax=Trypanosoma brucei TaxID=5691 RepID=A0A1J0R978_9TRYP|nr:variant surface glycoprotein 1125.3088 [Trypanosoma brucei]